MLAILSTDAPKQTMIWLGSFFTAFTHFPVSTSHLDEGSRIPAAKGGRQCYPPIKHKDRALELFLTKSGSSCASRVHTCLVSRETMTMPKLVVSTASRPTSKRSSTGDMDTPRMRNESELNRAWWPVSRMAFRNREKKRSKPSASASGTVHAISTDGAICLCKL